MKALVIEDRSAMTQMFCGKLDKFGIEKKVSNSVSDALEELKVYQPQIIILDSSVDHGEGMSFVHAITPVEEDKESRKDRKNKIDNGPSLLVIKTIYDAVPTDCPFLKYTLVRPFTDEQLTDAIRQVVPKDRKSEAPKLFEEQSAANPLVELDRRGISFGESYVFFEERPIHINQVLQVFANAGYDVMLLTHLRTKVARDKFGLDKGAEVFTMTGNYYPLGTMIDAVGKFLSEKKHPLVAVGDLENIIEHCGIDLTMRAVKQILAFRDAKNVRFTFLTSIDDSLLTANVRGLLTEMMTEYKTKEA